MANMLTDVRVNRPIQLHFNHVTITHVLFGTSDRFLSNLLFPLVMQVEFSLWMNMLQSFSIWIIWYISRTGNAFYRSIRGNEIEQQTDVGFPRKSILFPWYMAELSIPTRCRRSAERTHCEGRSAVVFRSNLQNYLFGLSVKFLPFSEKSQTIIKKN